ncbi:hypothetical protein PT300_13505 [Enterobacteriaceae bacterium ESL0689]|nr:hypothetical protein [Enterobacteriaceae bacterium ESL0689]
MSLPNPLCVGIDVSEATLGVATRGKYPGISVFWHVFVRALVA